MTYRPTTKSSNTTGVTNISNSFLTLEVPRDLKRLPSTGTSPSNGTLSSTLLSSCSKIPPIITVPPLSMATSVSTSLTATSTLNSSTALSLFFEALICIKTCPLGAICGVTSSINSASTGTTVSCTPPPCAAGLKIRYVMRLPCCIFAFCKSPVTTLGLEMMRPRLSDSSACSSRFKNRLAAGLNNDNANLGTSDTPLAIFLGAGRLTKDVLLFVITFDV